MQQRYNNKVLVAALRLKKFHFHIHPCIPVLKDHCIRCIAYVVFIALLIVTRRQKIVSNYCFKQCSNKFCLQYIALLMPFITLRNSTHISLRNSKKKL